VTLERVRSCGMNLLWTFARLASPANKGLRIYRARRRREVARAMAEDRFVLTDLGRAALAAAGLPREAARA
jgi:hypothetical protein